MVHPTSFAEGRYGVKRFLGEGGKLNLLQLSPKWKVSPSLAALR